MFRNCEWGSVQQKQTALFPGGHFKIVTVRLFRGDCSLHYWGHENSKQEDRENVQFVGEMSMSRINVTVKEVHTKPLCLLKRLVKLKRNLALCQASKKGTLRARPHPSKASAFKTTVSSYNFDACKTSSTWPRLSSSSADLGRSLAPQFPWTTFTIMSVCWPWGGTFLGCHFPGTGSPFRGGLSSGTLLPNQSTFSQAGTLLGGHLFCCRGAKQEACL